MTGFTGDWLTVVSSPQDDRPVQSDSENPMSYYPHQQMMVPVRHQCSTAHIVIAWIVAVCTWLYMLPWAIAATRNKSNVGAIALINVLLGWSVVGWVVALVMACTSESPGVVVINNGYAPQNYYGPGQPQLHGHPYQPGGRHPVTQQRQFGQAPLPPSAQHTPPPVIYGDAPATGYGDQYAFGMSSRPVRHLRRNHPETAHVRPPTRDLRPVPG